VPSASDEPVVFLVDDDPAVRKALPRALKARGYTVESFASATEFLETFDPQRKGCLILDLSMPEMTGLELQQHLTARAPTLPVIFITGHGSIPQSVTALRAGALDFLEKPFRQEALLQRIEEAFASHHAKEAVTDGAATMQDRVARLTEREIDVLRLLTCASDKPSNKEIARELDISHRTVEHRLMRNRAPFSILLSASSNP